MVPGITKYFHELAGMAVYFAVLIVVSMVVAAIAARAWGRTKQQRQAIYSVVGFIGLIIAGILMISRIRGLKVTP